MREVVHGDGELVALGGTAWFGGPCLLEAGIEHQGVDRRAARQRNLAVRIPRICASVRA
jgi:hypothetical protein